MSASPNKTRGGYGKAERAQSLVKEELKAGADALGLISETMIPAVDEVGKLFPEEEFFVPELMLAGRAMEAVGTSTASKSW